MKLDVLLKSDSESSKRAQGQETRIHNADIRSDKRQRETATQYTQKGNQGRVETPGK